MDPELQNSSQLGKYCNENSHNNNSSHHSNACQKLLYLRIDIRVSLLISGRFSRKSRFPRLAYGQNLCLFQLPGPCLCHRNRHKSRHRNRNCPHPGNRHTRRNRIPGFFLLRSGCPAGCKPLSCRFHTPCHAVFACCPVSDGARMPELCPFITTGPVFLACLIWLNSSFEITIVGEEVSTSGSSVTKSSSGSTRAWRRSAISS